MFKQCCFSDKFPVHVVVDPILTKVLRPHQREVNIYYFLHILLICSKNIYYIVLITTTHDKLGSLMCPVYITDAWEHFSWEEPVRISF